MRYFWYTWNFDIWSMSNTVDFVQQHFQDASSHLFDIVIVYIHPSLNTIFQTWGDPTQDPMIDIDGYKIDHNSQ